MIEIKINLNQSIEIEKDIKNNNMISSDDYLFNNDDIGLIALSFDNDDDDDIINLKIFDIIDIVKKLSLIS